MCLLGVVERRYIDFLIYLSLLHFFGSSIPNFCLFLGVFLLFFIMKNVIRKAISIDLCSATFCILAITGKLSWT